MHLLALMLVSVFLSQDFERTSDASVDRSCATQSEISCDHLQTPSQSESEMQNRTLLLVQPTQIPVEQFEILDRKGFNPGSHRSILPGSSTSLRSNTISRGIDQDPVQPGFKLPGLVESRKFGGTFHHGVLHDVQSGGFIETRHSYR